MKQPEQNNTSTLSEHLILKVIIWCLMAILGLGVFNSGAYIATNAKFLGPDLAVAIGTMATAFYLFLVIKYNRIIELAVYGFLAYKMLQDVMGYLQSFTEYIGLENATAFFQNLTQGNGFF